MSDFFRATPEQIGDWEAAGELWVCPVCDHHTHVDHVGDRCPSCGEETDDPATEEPQP